MEKLGGRFVGTKVRNKKERQTDRKIERKKKEAHRFSTAFTVSNLLDCQHTNQWAGLRHTIQDNNETKNTEQNMSFHCPTTPHVRLR